MKNCFIIFLMLSSTFVTAQHFVFVSSLRDGSDDTNKFYFVDLETNNIVDSLIYPLVAPNTRKLSISNDSLFHIFSISSRLSTYKFNGTDLQVIDENINIDIPNEAAGVDVDDDGKLYFAKEDIFQFDPETNTLVDLNLLTLNAERSFRLAVYKDSLIFQDNDVLFPQSFKMFMISNDWNDKKEIVNTFLNTNFIEDFKSVQCHCEDVKIIVISGDRLIEVDLIEKTHSEWYDLSRPELETRKGTGDFIGYPSWSDCALSVDLDFNSEKIQLDRDFVSDTICGFINVSIVGDSVQVFSSRGSIDSIHVEILNPQPSMTLSSFVSNNIVVRGQGTHNIGLINSGAASFDDFEESLKNLFYIDSSLSLIAPKIEIEVSAFKDGDVGIVAKSTLHLSEHPEPIDLLPSIEVCNDIGELNLSDFLLSSHDSGYWINGSSLVKINTQGDTTFYFVEENKHCINDTAKIEVNVLPIARLFELDTILCEGESILFNDLVISNDFQNLDTLLNVNGCDSIIYDLNIEFVDPVYIIKDSILCQGDVFLFENNILQEDTILTEIIYDVNGCDSLLNELNITFTKPQLIEIDTILCAFQSVTIYGQQYLPPFEEELTLSNVQGCDSLVIDINLELIEVDEIMDTIYYNVINGDEVQIELEYPLNINEIEWTHTDLSCNDCFSPTLIADRDLIFDAILTTDEGCIITIPIKIIVINQIDQIYIPNVIDISDPINSHFYISTSIPIEYDLYIFDRWGNNVFHANRILSNIPDQGWDGRYAGQNLNVGVYVYKIITKENKSIIGDILLLK